MENEERSSERGFQTTFLFFHYLFLMNFLSIYRTEFNSPFSIISRIHIQFIFFYWK
ncbi:hypothetical protein MCC93_22210 [Morococcus cerebrosus]|uniref:Uncharacterized protein n=1 Tax=Morococcus cerebrosus TaxID=1056807 RepID=A0A0C1E3G7_9NEIS|nr:hypothetical protein MCC93_22210 [Morococcus cerebrosus]